MQGYLEIWQGYFSRWNKFYFRIHDETLLFGASKEEMEGKIHLKVAQIISSIDDPVSFIIHTGTQPVYLRAFSIDQKVRWCKKLKNIQKEIINWKQNHELNQMKMELGQSNRIKTLQQLNMELWKCHAQLQRRLEESFVKIKNSVTAKSIVDKLRMTADEFKFKTSEILHFIQEEVQDLKNKQNNSNVDGYNQRLLTHYNQEDSVLNDTHHPSKQNQTKFYSFYAEELPPINNTPIRQLQKVSRKQSRKKEDDSFDEFERDLNEGGRHTAASFPKKKYSILVQNDIKNRLLTQNAVFKKINKSLFTRNEFRTELPQKFIPEQKFPVMNTLSGALSSSDLSKMSLPVTANQPLSILQKGCEQMYYSDLLVDADKQENQVMRMVYVMAFVVSGYSLTQGRIKKPFNPLLGQTFEFIDEKRGFEFIGEQVSHHPPISAFYVRSDHFQFMDNSKSKTSFTGTAIKLTPQSLAVLKLEHLEDTYLISKCIVSLNNLLIGKTYIENYGDVTIKCKQLQTQAVIHFREQSIWRSGQYNLIQGSIKYKGNTQFEIQGKWNQSVNVKNMKSGEVFTVWKKTHKQNNQYYNFNDYSFQLNYLTSALLKTIAPTDSRLRPDQRALQYRLLDLAAQEKHRLEQKQRTRRKQNESKGLQHKILWFDKKVIDGEQGWVSNGKYWDEKIKSSWSACIDIF